MSETTHYSNYSLWTGLYTLFNMCFSDTLHVSLCLYYLYACTHTCIVTLLYVDVCVWVSGFVCVHYFACLAFQVHSCKVQGLAHIRCWAGSEGRGVKGSQLWRVIPALCLLYSSTASLSSHLTAVVFSTLVLGRSPVHAWNMQELISMAFLSKIRHPDPLWQVTPLWHVAVNYSKLFCVYTYEKRQKKADPYIQVLMLTSRSSSALIQFK